MRDNSSDNTGLTAAEISKFKALLLAKRNELLGNVSSMEIEALRRESSDLSRLPIHMADIGTDNYEMEHALGLMCMASAILIPSTAVEIIPPA